MTDLLDQLPAALFSATFDGRLVAMNRAFLELWRCPEDERESLAASDSRQFHIDPANAQRLRDALIEHGQVQAFEGQYRLWDGSSHWIRADVVLDRGDDGEHVLLRGSLTSIEAEKQAQRALRVDLAVQRVEAAALRMQSPADWSNLVVAFDEAAREVIDFQSCSINLVDWSEGRLRAFARRDHDLVTEVVQASISPALCRAVESGQPVYRPADGYPLPEHLSRDGVCSLLDVPFEGGTVGVNSLHPQAFGEQDAIALTRFARALSAASVRLADLAALEAHTAALQAEVDARRAADAERRLQALVLDQIADRVTVTDLDGRITYVNQSQLQTLGYQRSELLGQSVQVYGEDPARGASQREIIMSTRTSGGWHGSVTNYTVDGSEVHLECRTQVVVDDDGTPIGLCGVATDVSDLRRRDDELRAANHRYNELVSQIPVGVYTVTIGTDSNDRVDYCSPQLLRMLDRVESGPPSRVSDLFAFVQPDELAGLLAKHREAALSPQPLYWEGRASIQGARRQVRIEALPTPLDHGGSRWSGVVADITEQWLARECLRARAELSDIALEADLGELLQSAVDLAERLTDSEIGFFHFVDEDQLNLELQVWSTNTTRSTCSMEAKGRHYPIAEAGIWAECYETRQPVIHNDYHSHPRRKSLPGGHAPVVRELVVPLVRGGLVRAILGVGNKLTDYTQGDVVLATAVTDVVADLIDLKRAERDRRLAEAALAQRQEAYRTLFNEMLEGFALHEIIVDDAGQPVDYRWLAVNPAFEQMTGLLAAEVVGRTVKEVIPSIESAWIERYGRVALTGRPECFEDRVSELDKCFEVRAYRPSFGQFACMIQDVTERTKARDALRESEARFSAAFHNAPVLMAIIDFETGRYVEVNEKMSRVTGHPSAELVGRSPVMAGLIPRRGVVELLAAIDANGRVDGLSMQLTAQSGETIDVLVSGDVVTLGGRRCLLAAAVDVTERNRVAAAMQAADAKYKAIFDSATEGIYQTDMDGRLLTINQAGASLLGFASPAEAVAALANVGQQVYADPARQREFRERCRLEGHVIGFEFEAIKADGSSAILSNSGRFVVDETGEPLGIQGTLQDVTSRRQAEEERELLRVAIEQSEDAIMITDAHGSIIYANPASEDGRGHHLEEVIGRHTACSEQPDNVYQEVWATISSGTVWRGQLAARVGDGNPRTDAVTISPVRDATGASVNYVAVKHDVTDQARLQARLAQAEKLETVGRLAGGVAHDFNNMLAVIIGNTEAAVEQAAEDETLRADLLEVLDAAGRSAQLTRQLLAFARQQPISPRVLDLNETISGMLKMLQRLIGENIALSWHPEPSLWSVLVDPSQVDQVLANLCINARDAIADTGHVRLSTQNVQIIAPGAGSPVAMVCLSVTDDGCGMDADTAAHAFEPFYSTKAPGKGTGLGLATIYGIAEQNGGHAEIESSCGIGTTVRVYLPRTENHEQADAGPLGTAAEPTVGKATILLVEDEPSVLRLAQRTLERAGYEVVSAQSAVEALSSAREHDHIDALVSDVMMPGMNGPAMANELRLLHPALRCVFISGHDAGILGRVSAGAAGDVFLPKPFDRASLLRAVALSGATRP